MKFKKKPIIVEAKQVTSDSIDEIADWCAGGKRFPVCASNPNLFAAAGIDFLHPYISIQTLEGEMKALLGDWVIKGVKGEFYPCKPDIFEATYEAAE